MLCLVLLVSSSLPVLGQGSVTAPQNCAAVVNGLNFICGVVDPEDLIHIPNSQWLIASGYDPGGGLLAGSGLKIVDTASKNFSSLYQALPSQIAYDRTGYPNCAGAPPANLVAHGLYLRQDRAGRYLLYAVAHAPRESVEIFILDAAGAPKLSWVGCIPLPAGLKGNGVAAYSDGTLLVTVLSVPGSAGADGIAKGVVLQWKPGDSGFQTISGTELPQDNGIEISKDEKEFFVVGFGDATIYVFSRANPKVPLRSVKAPLFVPDNLRWSEDRLIAMGPMYDEPACGGTRREAIQLLGDVARKPGGGCNRGYMAAVLDPVAMSWKVLAYAEPNPQIGIISSGVIVGDTLWIGAALSPGLAYRTLPHPGK
jgi:hypothetical protein